MDSSLYRVHVKEFASVKSRKCAIHSLPYLQVAELVPAELRKFRILFWLPDLTKKCQLVTLASQNPKHSRFRIWLLVRFWNTGNYFERLVTAVDWKHFYASIYPIHGAGSIVFFSGYLSVHTYVCLWRHFSTCLPSTSCLSYCCKIVDSNKVRC